MPHDIAEIFDLHIRIVPSNTAAGTGALANTHVQTLCLAGEAVACTRVGCGGGPTLYDTCCQTGSKLC